MNASTSTSFIPALRLFLALTLLTGVVYPGLVTLIGQLGFSHQANGSMLIRHQKIVGSSLIAQEFKGQAFFHARPSAIGFNPMPSGASNLAPTSADLLKAIDERSALGDVEDLLFTSGSGLDPEESVVAALSQVDRVAQATGLSVESVQGLVQKHSEGRTFGFLGEARVNVLLLNLDLLEATETKR